jgi:predicted ATPase
MIRIYIGNIGPFESTSIEIKPLTILIGKNSVGKSLLLYLLWALASAVPALDEVESGWEEVSKVTEKVVEKVQKGENPEEEIKQALPIFYEKILKEAIRIGIEERIRYAFGVEPKELVKNGKKKALIKIQSDCAKLEIAISNTVELIDVDLCLDKMLNALHVKVLRRGAIEVEYEDLYEEFEIRSVTDVNNIIVQLFVYHIAHVFDVFILTTSEISTLLPDSRAGITRTVLKPYPVTGIPLGVDEEYKSMYFRLAEQLYREPQVAGQVLNTAKPLFEELGAVPEVRFEAGAYTVYIRTWTGKVLPFSMAPSGVREVLTTVLALATPYDIKNVFVEEPEAHLHPRALKFLTKLIAWSINTRSKRVVVTTHSDYLISYLNNLIIASRLPNEKLSKLDLSMEEVLRPDDVAVYLVKTVNGNAVIELVQVTEHGILEEEFSKIAEELLSERDKIYAEL